MEIIVDVFVGTILAFLAGGLAIYNGGIFIGVVIILVTIPTFVFWFLLIAFSVKNTLRMPAFSLKIIQKFVGREKAEKIFNKANIAIADLCKMSRQNFYSRKGSWKTFSTGVLITFVAFLLQGLSFMILANSVHSNISLFQSVMSTSASTALSNLPITIGGSGLAELGIWAYLSNLNGIMSVKGVDKSFQLSVIVVWRIASYHIPLIFMWIALMKLALGKKTS